MTLAADSDDALTIEKHGDILVVVASRLLEHMPAEYTEGAAALILEPLKDMDGPLLVMDLSNIERIGSPFLAMMIRCWKRVSERGGSMALSGVSDEIHQLLNITRFETLWPIYKTQREALAALNSD